VDEGGAFRVGPRSAGAVPGPACYGHGGTEPTVTDAHAVLGRLDPEHFLGGNMKLYPERAHEVVGDLAARLGMEEQEAAAGIVTILNSNMANATHAITTQKGHDPREFSLVAFGGAGPLHAAEVARILGVKEVIIPAYPGINSAIGLLTTDLKYDAIATQFTLSADPNLERLNEDLERLEGEVRSQLRSDGVPEEDISVLRGVDCRYVGQGYELRVALPEGRIDEDNVGQVWQRMHDLHRLEYGHAFPDNPIELVNLRVSGVGRTPKITEVPVGGERSLQRARLKEREVRFRVGESLESVPTVFYERDLLPVGERVEGPAVVVQGDTTTVLPPGASGALDEEGNLILELREV
jgi:N-methylhydantoinase A